MKRLIILTACFLLAAQLQAGELSKWSGPGSVYKWTDETGKVNYSQYPPAGVESVEVTPDYPTPLEGGSPAGESQAVASADDAAANQAQPPGEQTQAQKNCVTAKNNLALLENPGTKLSYKNDKGESVDVDDKERAARIETAKKNVSEFCK